MGSTDTQRVDYTLANFPAYGTSEAALAHLAATLMSRGSSHRGTRGDTRVISRLSEGGILRWKISLSAIFHGTKNSSESEVIAARWPSLVLLS